CGGGAGGWGAANPRRGGGGGGSRCRTPSRCGSHSTRTGADCQPNSNGSANSMASDHVTWVRTGTRIRSPLEPGAQRRRPAHVARREGGHRVRRGGGRYRMPRNGRVGGATEEVLFGARVH